MDPTGSMCKSLVKWLQTIVPVRSRNIQEICDGVAMVAALMQISPDHFSKLEPKIKKDVGANWRLKISNLKKIVQAVIEYYQDVLGLQLLEVVQPNVSAIGEHNDPMELAKLLQLILGCAINCDRKQEYITKIMEMEESVQQSIMQAIQQLEEVTDGPGKSGLSFSVIDSDAKLRLINELEVVSEAKETLRQHCQSLESQIQILLEEKQALLQENDILKEKEARNPDSRKQLEILKEELFKAEVMRDDFKAKVMEQDKQMLAYQEKIAELQLAASATSRLKDEVDALSESAVKAQNLELTLNSYKQKLENYSDIKKTLKNLEEKNMEYIQRNMELEEELTKNNGWKTQCDNYKQQLVNLQQKLDEETQRADKAQFNVDKLDAKLVALQGEKERLLQERDNLREENEELRLGKPKEETGAAMLQELTPKEMKERLRFLEKENKTLRSSSQELEAKQSLLDNALSRIEKLQQQVRSYNQTILKLEAQLEEGNKNPSNESPQENMHKECRQKIINLQETLAAKENELQINQAKYARSLEKAREVAQQLEPKSNGSLENSLRNTHMKELEEKLLTSAYHRLAMSCHREAMDERIAALSAGQGQSFLARQRQATPRKQIQKFKSK